jgi:L-serine dehydratase
MTISAFDLCSVGIGTSSSHTDGPMKAARMFVDQLSGESLRRLDRLTVDLYGSLGATAHGPAPSRL